MSQYLGGCSYEEGTDVLNSTFSCRDWPISAGCEIPVVDVLRIINELNLFWFVVFWVAFWGFLFGFLVGWLGFVYFVILSGEFLHIILNK